VKAQSNQENCAVKNSVVHECLVVFMVFTAVSLRQLEKMRLWPSAQDRLNFNGPLHRRLGAWLQIGADQHPVLAEGADDRVLRQS
jgi:hypothetical protein